MDPDDENGSIGRALAMVHAVQRPLRSFPPRASCMRLALHQQDALACSGALQPVRIGSRRVLVGSGMTAGQRMADGCWGRCNCKLCRTKGMEKRCSYQPQSRPRCLPSTARGVWFLEDRHPNRVAWRCGLSPGLARAWLPLGSFRVPGYVNVAWYDRFMSLGSEILEQAAEVNQRGT